MAGEKFTNIVGVPFKKYVKRQLEARAFQGSTINRTNDQVMYLANKNCWIRLVSFVDVQDKESVGESGNYLARNWMLFGGTSYMTQNENGAYNVNNLRFGLETEAFTPGVGLDTRITNNSAYGLGGIDQFGYRPMPGITSATIEHAGTAGSLRMANIKFKVWNREQLNIIDALYFRLGFSCLLEWGHTSYIKNGTNELETIILPLDVFNDPAMKTKEGISRRISEKRKETYGNYDAMYGLISNYEWNQSSDGGYECTVKLVGLGSVIDSLKINQVYGQTEAVGETSKISTSNSSILRGGNPNVSLPNAPSLQEPYITGNNLAFPQVPIIYAPDSGTVKLDLSPNSLFRTSYGTYKMKYVYQNADGSLKAGTIKKEGDNEIYTAEMLSYAGISDFEQIVKDIPFKFKIVDSKDIGGKPIKNIVFYSTVKVTDGRTVYFTKAKVPNGEKVVLTPKSFGDSILEIGEVGAKLIFLPAIVSSKLAKLGWNYFFPSDTKEKTNEQKESNPTTTNLKNIYLEYTLPFNDSVFNYITPDITDLNTLVAVDKKDIDNNIQRTLIVFYSTYHFDNISEDGGKTIKKPELITYTNKDVSATADNFVLQKSKLNNTNQAEIRVAIKVQDKGGNATPGNAFRAAVANKLLKDLINSVQSTYNGFAYKGLVELNLRNIDDLIKKELFNEEKAILGGNTWRVPGIVLATITYKYNEEALAASAVSSNDVPVDSTDTVQSTLPVIYSNNIDKFLIALRDSVGPGETGKIDRRAFIEDQLKNGSLEKIRNKNITIDPNKSLTNLNIEELLYAYIQKGFNSELVAGDTEDKENLAISYDMVPDVNFTNPNLDDYLFEIYKSGLFDEIGTGETSKFIYIKLGLLLYYINNLCLLYESNDSEEPKKPFVYLDFNPATNFCLTTQYHFSVDPGVCIMPINLSDDAYLSLFPNKLLDPAIAFKTSEDNVSNQVNSGFNAEVSQNRGKLMNLGINMDYVINLLRSQATNNPKSDVYLRSFLETLMDDVNKSLGNINLFRVGYYDDANTVRIYDDQIINPPSFQSLIDVNNNSELYPYGIPIMGKNSIVRSLTLKTETSTALSNEIAISAQTGNFGAMNSDASSLGNLNKNQRFIITDRVMKIKQTAINPSLTQKEKEAIEADKSAALNFNKHVKNIYNAQTYVKGDVDIAKNYYCSAANKLKADSVSTISRKVLPISINISTDGISGMSLLEGFTIPTDILPSQYQDSLGRSKVGFAVAGLNHSIEGNQWITNIRGQMINLPVSGSINSSEFGQSSISTNVSQQAPSNYVYEDPGPPVPIGSNPLLKDQEFLNRVGQIARKYGFNPEDVLKCFHAESGISTKAPNRQEGRLIAAGIMQWTIASGVLNYKSSKKFGVRSLEDILRLSPLQQLDMADEYFSYAPVSRLTQQEKGSFFGLYLLVFFPAFAGLPDSAIAKTSKVSAETISRQNGGIAKAAGKVPGQPLTKGDFRTYCAKKFNIKLPSGLKFA